MAIADLPDLQAAIARRFRILQQFGPMDVLPVIVPVVQVDPVSVSVSTGPGAAVFSPADFVSGSNLAPIVAGTVVRTTGPLPAGAYDVFAVATMLIDGPGEFRLDHFDGVTIRGIGLFPELTAIRHVYESGLEVDEQAEIRFVITTTLPIGNRLYTSIGAHRRS